jgi:outer membrane protein assembly factor BamB
MPRTSNGRGRRRWMLAIGLLIALLGAGIAFVVVAERRPTNISNPAVTFVPTAPEAPEPTATTTTVRSDEFDDRFSWPVYGLSKARTKYLPLATPLRPPFLLRWKVGGSTLLEFTPVMCGGQLFLLKNNGALYGISKRTGRVRWKRKLGYLAAASPACGHGSVYVALLARGKGVNGGRIVAVRAGDGRTRWSRPLPSRSESSPLLDRGRLYFGSEDGTVFALRAADGAVRWTYRAGGAVKGGLALSDGRLFFGDYAGQVTALRRADGARLWRASGAGAGFGRSGQFYATPAVAYGRVYIGSTDGFVSSYGAADGKLAWRHRTNGYVYSSPAVSPVRGGTVYAGSYDGKLYAFDARTGNVKWTRATGGRLSGGIQVIGDLVFYSNLGRRSVGAVGAANGKLIWSFGRGAFNPLISDGTHLYVVGYTSLYMLSPPVASRAASSGRRNSAAARRAVAARVARRRAEVHRVNRLRERHQKICFSSGSKRTCRLPRPLVCFKGAGGRTTCRPRKPVVCLPRKTGEKRVCRPRRD